MTDKTDAQIASDLQAEGQVHSFLEQAAAAGYDIIAFNVATDLVPLSWDYARMYGPGNSKLDGYTFAMPGPEYNSAKYWRYSSWPRIWRIAETIMERGTCGSGNRDGKGHHYQVAPACGPRIYVLEAGEWALLR